MKTPCHASARRALPPESAADPLAVTAARLACRLDEGIKHFVHASDQNLEHLEVQIAQQTQELLRQATEAGAQARADATPPVCPVCQHMLMRCSAEHLRSFDTRHGPVSVRRTRGYCKRCRKWCVPADTALGLDDTAGYSPAVQDRGDTLGHRRAARATPRRGVAARPGAGPDSLGLVLADGAVWIWRLADDRFPHARQRLDFYHAVQHIAAVGRLRFGDDEAALHAWLAPLKRQLKNDSAIQVIRQLEDVLADLAADSPAHKTVAAEVAYLHEHQDRMDYRAARRRKEPIGSGAVESTCRQYQCRFKRSGQFWSQAGDEALLNLEMFWRNGRWHLLFPHSHPHDLSKN